MESTGLSIQSVRAADMGDVEVHRQPFFGDISLARAAH
jgi:hypothetical protein